MSRTNALRISPDKAGPSLTPPQKRFNTLIRQIEAARQTLAAWHESIAAYREADARVLLPLRAELVTARRQWVFALDGLLAQGGWTRAERATLRELVCDAAGELLAARDGDAQLKELFDRHAEVDFDTERREQARAMKDLTEALTGLDLGDEADIHTEAEFFERMEQGLQERAAAEEAERSTRAARRSRPRSRCARFSASWPARCTPTTKPMSGNARKRPR